MADYPLKQEAAEVQDILDGAFLSNKGQNFSEETKAFMREKIGASAAGEGLKIISHFDSVEELQATVTAPTAGDAYSVGTELPYNLYIFDFLNGVWRNYGPIRANDIKARLLQNSPVGSWEKDEDVFPDYTFKAKLPLAETTGNDFPIVAFSPADAIGGNYCPIAYAFDGYVEIWAKAIPATELIVPVVTLIIQDTGDSTTGNSTKGITNASGGVPTGGVGTNQLANRSITAQKIAPNAVSKVFTAEIGTEWTGSAAPYTQEIIVEDLPNSERIIADINLSDDWELATEEYEDFGKITKITASSGKITAYASEPTTTSLHIKLVLLNNGEYSDAAGLQGDSSGGSGGGSGADGFSPIAKVVQTETGATISITDKDGTTTATISNGKDGAQGPAGPAGPQGEPGLTGPTGKDGAAGKDGTSVTVKSVSESNADGGSNIVTFSDGKTLTIKNGSKGRQGEPGAAGSPGAAGYTPVKGTDYYTDADKAEMVEAVIAALPTLIISGKDAAGTTHKWTVYTVDPQEPVD